MISTIVPPAAAQLADPMVVIAEILARGPQEGVRFINDNGWTPAQRTAALVSLLQSNVIARIFVPSGEYTVDAIEATLTSGKHIDCSPGAIFIRNGLDQTITLKAGEAFVETVASYATVATAIAEDGASTTPVSVLTLANAQTVKRGDLVRVISDDEILGATPGTSTVKRRRGEVAAVGLDSTGTKVTLTGILRDTYTTNVRVLKMNKTRLTWSGGQFDYNDTAFNAGAYAPHVEIWGFVEPKLLGIKVLRSAGAAIRPCGCYGAIIDQLDGRLAINSVSANRYGYLVDDMGCEGTRVVNATATHCRHVYTTNSFTISAGDTRYALYGKTRDATIVNGIGVGCSNTPFDTHDECENITFSHCKAIGAYVGSSSGGGGYSARGIGVTFDTCIADGCRAGFTLNAYAGVTLTNCQALRCAVLPLSVSTSATGVAQDSLRNKVIGGRFETLNTNSAVLTTTPASTFIVDLDIDGATFAVLGSVNLFNSTAFKQARVRMRNVVFDFSGYTVAAGAGRPRIICPDATFSNIRIDGLRIIPPASTNIDAITFSNAATAAIVDIKGVEYEGVQDFQGQNAANGNQFAANGNVPNTRVSGYKVVNGTRSVSSYHTQAASAAGVIASPGYIGDPQVVSTITGTGGVTMSLPTANRRQGDRWKVRNDTNGTLTIGTPVIPAGASQEYVHSGSAWLVA